MGVNTITAPPINVIHCPLEDGMVCGVVAINATRSGYKYGNEESQYPEKRRGCFKWVVRTVKTEKTLCRALH
jgi:hypothetical protein